MRQLCTAAIALLLACTSIALAAGSSDSGRFTKQVQGTDRRIAINEARFADRVFFQFSIAATDGEHALDLNVYDGEGREVYNSQSTLVARSGRAGGSVSYGFDAYRDAPGTWWYVAAIDGKIVVSSSIQVTR